MRLARLRCELNTLVDLIMCMGREPRIVPKGTIVQARGKSLFFDTYLCDIPGYSRVRHVATRYLEFLGETVEDQPEET
mgnify:CR=1 FL=1